MAIIDTRRDQMFPSLQPEEIDRIRRFGDIAHAKAGAVLAKAGEVSPGLMVVLEGRAQVTRRDAMEESHLIVEHGPGPSSASWPSCRTARRWSTSTP
jgi:thioredoxin reductase (NADPH)